jgi:hypothetical protein
MAAHHPEYLPRAARIIEVDWEGISAGMDAG